MIDESGPDPATERWLRDAAALNDVEAQYDLGVVLFKRDEPTGAEKLWRRAAGSGYAKAAYRLGVLFESRGTADDIAEAEQWWRTAATAGHAAAAHSLGVLLDRRGSVEASAWWERAAGAGHLEAQFDLGGWHFERNRMDDALRWWLSAATGGHLDAQYNVARALVDDDRTAALRWLERAAEHDHPESLYLLWYLRRAEGTDPATERPLVRAAELGDADAQFALGLMRFQLGHPAALIEAESWWRRASTAGHAQAAYNLGVLLRQRDGAASDAESLWRQAAESGHDTARQALSTLTCTARPSAMRKTGRE